MLKREASQKRNIEVRNQKLDDDEFFKAREQVLGLWPTGKEVNLEEALERHANLPDRKRFVQKVLQGRQDGKTLIQPRSGVGLMDEFIETCRVMEKEGRADLLPSTTDSYTRYSKYDLTEKAIRESEKTGQNMLNGTPLVNWGVKGCCKVIDSIGVPIDARSGDLLAYEIALASGFTSILAGALAKLSYWPKLPPEESIRMYQPLFKLVGYYEEKGAPIFVDVLPIQSISFYADSLEIATNIIDALLVAEQGAKNLCLRFQQNCHIAQDVAKGEALRELGKEYFERQGHGDAEIYLSLDTWASPFPQDWGQASVFGVMAGIVANYTHSDRLMVKSVDEAVGLPGNQSQVFSLRAAKQALLMMKGQPFPMTNEVKLEKEMMKNEARAIIDKVFEMGDGDLALGAVHAIDAGVLDHTYSSNIYNAGKALAVRDITGKARYLNCENLPFTREMKEFHSQRIEERKRAENLESDYDLLIRDNLAFARPLEEIEAD